MRELRLIPIQQISSIVFRAFSRGASSERPMGREVVVAVTDGRLDFGTWEQIFYGEFDGMRDKRVLVKIIGE